MNAVIAAACFPEESAGYVVEIRRAELVDSNNLRRALDSVWDHLSGTISEPFQAGDHKRISVRAMDGNEPPVGKELP